MVENPVATRQCMQAFMKMRCEMTYWARDRCHLRKVVYLRCSFLVLSASPCLYWKRSAPVGSGLRDYEQSIMPTDHLHLWSVIVIKRTEFDRWLHIISTSVGISHASILTWNYGIRMELHQQCCNKHTVQCTVDCTAVCVHMHDAGVDTVWLGLPKIYDVYTVSLLLASVHLHSTADLTLSVSNTHTL